MELEAFSLKCFFFNIENKMHLFRPQSFFNFNFLSDLESLFVKFLSSVLMY